MLRKSTLGALRKTNRPAGSEEGEWGRLGWYSVEAVSLLLHRRFLFEFVNPGMRVLEVAAGTGSFTRTLAELGCRIVVAGMSAGQLSRHRARSVELAFDHAVEGRVLLDTGDLSPIVEESFDLVVCFGGASGQHPAQGIPAMNECARVCRAGGILILSVLSLSGAVHKYLHGGLRAPPEKRVGFRPRENFRMRSWVEARRRCQMFRAEELRRAAQEVGLEVVAMSASNVLSPGWEPFLSVTREDQERRRDLLGLEIMACREEDALDMGRRILLAAKKG